MAEPHPLQERLESGIPANRIELDGGSDEGQRAVAFFEGTLQPVEKLSRSASPKWTNAIHMAET